jgi:hypothetical protein
LSRVRHSAFVVDCSRGITDELSDGEGDFALLLVEHGEHTAFVRRNRAVASSCEANGAKDQEEPLMRSTLRMTAGVVPIPVEN